MRDARIVIIALLLMSAVMQGQNNEIWTFTKELNDLYKAKSGNVLDALRVVEDVKIDSVVSKSSKKETKAYSDALAAFNEAKKDSINALKKGGSSTNQNKDIAKIKTNINNFLNASGDYNSKKNFLVEAQTTADKYGINQLIYADAKINSSQKSKFFVLSKKPMDLKIHLKRVLTKIKVSDQATTVKEHPSFQAVAAARKKLKNTEQYTIIEGTTEITKTSSIRAGSLIFKPENVIMGNFKNKGVYYVTTIDEDVKDNLLTESELRAKNVSPSTLPYKYAFNIIQNIDTNEMFLVSTDFVKNANVSVNALGSSH